MYPHIRTRLQECDFYLIDAIVQCTASRISLAGDVKLLWPNCWGAITLVEVLNVVSIVCIDLGVVNGAVQSKHAVNNTLVYFNWMPTACFPVLSHKPWLSDLFYVRLQVSRHRSQKILFKKDLSFVLMSSFVLVWVINRFKRRFYIIYA